MLLLIAHLLVAHLAQLEARVAADPENLKLAAEYRQAVIADGEYDHAIKFFDQLAARPDAGPHAFLNLAFAYIDKIPAVGAFRRISLGNDATRALTRSIGREPSDLAYLVRGLVNLRFERGFFHRTPQGVADLEEALRRSAPHADRPYVARIYLALGDGYWRLKNPAKARDVWREGQARFPQNAAIRSRLRSPDRVVSDRIAQELDAGTRVDTSLADMVAD
jgi:tetratricopeptide (TPR) repeat protein